MSTCPLFVPAAGTGKAEKPNCGECGRWDAERQKCRDEEGLRGLEGLGRIAQLDASPQDSYQDS